MNIKIQRYESSFRSIWNRFNDSSSNGCFLFNRDFIEYHGDRFIDHSLLIYQKGKLIGLLPAARKNKVLQSHPGLSFGGLVFQEKNKTAVQKEIILSLEAYLIGNDFEALILDLVPVYYTSIQNDGFQYLLQELGARIQIRKISHFLDLQQTLNLNANRKKGMRNANRLQILEMEDLNLFYSLLTQELDKKYRALPIHTFDEIQKLKSLFPEHIRLFVGLLENQMVGGILTFEYPKVIKCQYISSNKLGYENEAITQIVAYLHDHFAKTKAFLDLGTSHLDDGSFQYPLIQFKESLGAKGSPLYRMEWEFNQ